METRRTGVRYTRAISLGTFVTFAIQTSASYKNKEREEASILTKTYLSLWNGENEKKSLIKAEQKCLG